MSFEPNKKTFKTFINTLDDIVKNNCTYPNETLFLCANITNGNNVYNLPIEFNSIHYALNKIKAKKYTIIILIVQYTNHWA